MEAGTRPAAVAMDDGRSGVAVIGAGRAGSALAVALAGAGYDIVAVHSRTRDGAAALAGRVGATVAATPLDAVRAARLTILAVPDGAITSVAATLAATGMALPGRALIHCCASQGRDSLSALRITTAAVGAIHPLQALAGPESAPLLRGSLFAVDVDPALEATAATLVARLGGTAMRLDAGSRALYHAAAVLAGNAPLALLAQAAGLLEHAGVDRATAGRGLAHLLAGAVANAQQHGDPVSALTGPVVRGDAETVRRHLDALVDEPAARDIYIATARTLLSSVGRDGRAAVAAVIDAAATTPRAVPRGGRTAA